MSQNDPTHTEDTYTMQAWDSACVVLGVKDKLQAALQREAAQRTHIPCVSIYRNIEHSNMRAHTHARTRAHTHTHTPAHAHAHTCTNTSREPQYGGSKQSLALKRCTTVLFRKDVACSRRLRLRRLKSASAERGQIQSKVVQLCYTL